MQLLGPKPLKRIAGLLGWTRASYMLMSAFAAIVLLIIVVWWPLAGEYLAYIDPSRPLWGQLDWLLIGVFVVAVRFGQIPATVAGFAAGLLLDLYAGEVVGISALAKTVAYLKAHPELRFVSDGERAVVSLPSEFAARLGGLRPEIGKTIVRY